MIKHNSSNSPIRLIIADDHPLFRAGVVHELSKISKFKILCQVGDGKTAIEKINEFLPDVAILDIMMPEMTGLEVAKIINSNPNCKTKIILLTMHNEQKIFFQAIENGVKGYVLKDALVNDIVKSIHTVMNDEYYLSPDLSGLLIQKTKISSRHTKESNLINKLTPSEKNILRLVAELKSNQEIADILFISKRTVENHKVNISKKLQTNGKNNLIKFAIENKTDL